MRRKSDYAAINDKSLIGMSHMPTHLFADDIWSSSDIVEQLQVKTDYYLMYTCDIFFD
jgi:hypothetical protein